jgi:parallel beta-helix repeat protein
VGSGPGNDTVSINDACINYANSGDTVFVHSGEYTEQIYITNKTINLIGEDKNTTIINGSGAKAIWVSSSNWVNITGFSITEASVGIYITSSSFINIQRNDIYGNGDGIFSQGASYCTIKNNIIHDQAKIGEGKGTGMFFQSDGGPYYNNYIGENFVFNNIQGIHLETQAWNNRIINNTVYNNSNDGISIDFGVNNSIIDNIVHHNGLGTINPRGGIALNKVHNHSITGNILHNNEHGILWWNAAWLSTENTIMRNMIYNNEYGIRIRDAEINTFIDNMIFNNNYSVFIERASNRNNFINCTLTNAMINVIMRNQSTENTFINCSLSNPTVYDFDLSDNSHAFLLNTTFNKTRVYYEDTSSSLSVNWYMHVNVIYWNRTPVSYANIWVNDTHGSSIINNGSVDFQGWTRWIMVAEYFEMDINGDHIGEKIFYYTPHHVTATDGLLWGDSHPIMDISKVVLIILGIPPPLLPPTNLTTKVVNNGNYVELEWDPSPSLALDHYLIYRADSATEFDFSIPYSNSATWLNPKDTHWIDPDPNITSMDDDFYYIVRAATFDESDISSTSNTAGVWTRTFKAGVSSFSLPLEPYTSQNIEVFLQDMNATYIKWMDPGLHRWMKHGDGVVNDTQLMQGKGYEVKFASQTRYTFCGMPGAMIKYHQNSLFGFDINSEANTLTATVNIAGNVILTWTQPMGMDLSCSYKIYRSAQRKGFFNGSALHVATISVGPIIWMDVGVALPGTKYYYMIVPVNATGLEGTSTYSIGVWTEEFLSEYDTIGIPLKTGVDQTIDWYKNNILNTQGINYYIYDEQRWGWHSTRMSEGIYDGTLEMMEGYQISTSSATKFSFIGR